MLQLHLSDQQFYCLLRCDLYHRFDGICMDLYSGNGVLPVRRQAISRTSAALLSTGLTGENFGKIVTITQLFNLRKLLKISSSEWRPSSWPPCIKSAFISCFALIFQQPLQGKRLSVSGQWSPNLFCFLPKICLPCIIKFTSAGTKFHYWSLYFKNMLFRTMIKAILERTIDAYRNKRLES